MIEQNSNATPRRTSLDHCTPLQKLPLIYLNAIVQRISGGRDGFDAVLAFELSWAAGSAELLRTTSYLDALLLVKNEFREFLPSAAI